MNANNVLGYVVGLAIAESVGIEDSDDAYSVALVGAALGGNNLGLILAAAAARSESAFPKDPQQTLAEISKALDKAGAADKAKARRELIALLEHHATKLREHEG